MILLLVAIPTAGAILSGLLVDHRTRRWIVALLSLELALGLVQLIHPFVGSNPSPPVLLGLPLGLRPAGSLAIAIGTLVVLVAVATGDASRVSRDALSSGLLGLAGLAVVTMLGNNAVAAALALGLVALVLLPIIESAPAPSFSERSARRYVIWVALGSSLLLLSGALDRFSTRQPDAMVLGSVAALFIVGIGIFIAAFPLSLWLPGLCADRPLGAGLAIGILTAATGSVVLGEIGANPALFDDASAWAAVGAVGGLAGIASATLAYGERNPARCVAFLISANADLALAGLAASPHGDPIGFTWSLGAQALAGALSLTCIGALNGKLDGLVWRRPVLAGTLVVAVASLIGLPLTAGYIGRWLIASVVVGNHPVLVVEAAVASVIGSLAALRAFGPIVSRFDQPADAPRVFDAAALAAAAVLVLAGLFPGAILSVLR